MSPHDYFQPDYESCVHYNKQTGGKTDLSLDLGKLLKFRPSKIENFEENLEGKSPSLFADCQVRVLTISDSEFGFVAYASFSGTTSGVPWFYSDHTDLFEGLM